MAVLLYVVNQIFLRAQIRTLLSPAITTVTVKVVTLIIVIIIQPVLIFFSPAILVLVILHLLLR